MNDPKVQKALQEQAAKTGKDAMAALQDPEAQPNPSPFGCSLYENGASMEGAEDDHGHLQREVSGICVASTGVARHEFISLGFGIPGAFI